MKKRDLKDYNRLLRDRNEVLEELLQLVSDSMDGDCYCKEIALIQEENTELVKDLNDLQADWAADHTIELALRDITLELGKDLNDLKADWAVDYAKYQITLINLVEKNTRECDENVKLQGKIAILKEDLETARKRLRETEA